LFYIDQLNSQGKGQGPARKHSLEIAATTLIVASLVFGMAVTTSSAPDFGAFAADTANAPFSGFGLLKQPAQF
jgi:hypothetical protein